MLLAFLLRLCLTKLGIPVDLFDGAIVKYCGKFKFIAYLSLFVFVSIILAQETHNLEIIWQKASPDSVFYFGSSLASGDFNGDGFSDIAVEGDSLHGDTWTHKAYIFFGGPQFDTIPDVVIVKGFTRLKGIGDINGDGFDDLALGSPNSPFGRVYIYLGGNPIDTICNFEMRGPQDASSFGEAIGSGDVNGDSYSDLIVGAYGAAPRPGGQDMGQVYIYYGGPNFDTIPDVILNGGHNNDQEEFGNSVGGGGDVNNDGYFDIIVGAFNFGPGSQGRIYIYYGGNPMDTIADVAMIGEGSNQHLGWYGVDFLKNNSTYYYAITGCQFWPYGFPHEGPGKVYVLFGGNLMDSIPDVWMIGRTDTSGLGECSASAGDINGDSCDDIISSAINEPGDFTGTVYVWLGGAMLDTIPDAWIRGTQPNDGIGWGIASAGDINDDGKDEIMVSNSASNLSPKRVWVCKYTGPGIEENSQPLTAIRIPLEVKPNPAKSFLAIRLPQTADRQTVKIFDVSGKIIREIATPLARNDQVGDIKISLKGINPGIYFLKVGKETKKFLVVR